MPSSFTITSPTNSVLLGANGQGQATFTVSNISGRLNRGRARLVPQNPLSAAWLKLNGEAERDFEIASTQQYSVAINVPPKSPAGSYVFRLDMVGVENPDEDLSQGPSVTFQVTEQIKKFPWWIVIVAVVAVLVIGGIIAVILLTRKTTVPDVSGSTQAAAQRILEGAGLKVGDSQRDFSGVVVKDLVIGTDPQAGEKVSPGSTVVMIVSNGPTATLTPTVTLTFTPTFTRVFTSTRTPTKVPPTKTPTWTPSPTPDTLVAWYELEHNTLDTTGRYPAATMVTSLGFQDNGASCNGVYQLGGSSDYCQISTPNLDTLNFNGFSISADFKPATVKRMPVFVGGRSYRWIGFYLLENGHVGLLWNNNQSLGLRRILCRERVV